MSGIRFWQRGRWSIEVVPSWRRPHLFWWNVPSMASPCAVDEDVYSGGVCLSWGDGNSDPLWAITYDFPEWLGRRLPERWPS